MTGELKAPVLVAGAGPTGLMMAAGLMRHRVPCRIIDKAPAASDKSRAVGIHARTMEIFEQAGLAEEFLRRGQKLRGMRITVEGKAVINATFERIPSRYPFVLALPQNETEAILEQHLGTLGVQVERAHELTALTQDAGGAAAVIRRPDGSDERFVASYLIGCDGAHSTVRHLLGMSFEGAEYEELFILADVQLRWQFGEDQARTYMTREGTAVYFPMGGGHYRIIVQLPPSAAASIGEQPTLSEVQSLVDRFGPAGTSISDPRWLANFRIHRRKVRSYRDGRVFLAGDAAHIHSPVGGQGMNTGIQDAHNLAWKLGLVFRGASAPALLDSYQAERHPVAEQVLRTTDTMTRLVTVRNPVARAVRDVVMPVVGSQEFLQKRFGVRLAELSVNYRDSPIVGQSRPRLRDTMRLAGGTRAWWAFSTGPRPGDRAPDAPGLSADERAGLRLYEIMDPARHNLILFGGTEPSVGGNMQEIGEMIERGFGALIAVHRLAAGPLIPKQWPRAIADAELKAHRAYGAVAPCIYLIRPDGYVGYRSLRGDAAGLSGYLSRVFRLRAFEA